jgi:hypothetical protein
MPQEATPEVEEFRRSALVGFLAEMLGHVSRRGGRSTVCLIPPAGTGDLPPEWSEVAGLEGLDTLATDPYWERFGQPVDPWVGHWSRAVRQVAQANGARGQVWIQAFGIGPERAEEVRAAVRSARGAGVDDLWAWGYEACGHMDGLGTPDPDRVSAVVTEALTSRSS